MATHVLRHPNSSSHHDVRKAKWKTARPAIAKRHSGYGTPRSGKSVQIKDDSDEDFMAASFLQYCATCEKQIVTPSNSILYCSESCRKKDQTHMPSYGGLADTTPPMTPLQTSSSFDRLPAHDIVPQRSPTHVNLSSKRWSYASASEDESLYSEDEQSLPSSRRDSEAMRYMEHLQHQHADSSARTPRPQYKRSSTNFSTISQAPELSYSPTSTTAGMSLPYTPAYRPLPPRTNPYYSTSMKFSKSIDLVNPFPSMPAIAPTTTPSSMYRTKKSQPSVETSQAVASGQVRYERAPIPLGTSAHEHGSLKKLFRFSEMQAPPTPASHF